MNTEITLPRQAHNAPGASLTVTIGDLAYLIPLTLPLAIAAALFADAPWWLIYPPAAFLVLVPLLDWMLPLLPSEPEAGHLPSNVFPGLFVVAHVATLAWALYASRGMSSAELVALAAALGLSGAVAIAASHELLHKQHSWVRHLGRLGMVSTLYPQFEVSHIYGHHRHACTKEDANTAWLGESLYAYLLRTIPASLRVAVATDRRRFGRRWIWKSPTGRGLVTSAMLVLAALAIDPRAFLVLSVSACIAVFMLEATSYIEHYGLMRDPAEAQGVLGRECSWDSRHAASNVLSFNLQYHAAHHERGSRGFLDLDSQDTSPTLPTGYPAMIALASVPPLFRAVMHSRMPAA